MKQHLQRLPACPPWELLPGVLLVIKVECTHEDKPFKRATTEFTEKNFLDKHDLITEPQEKMKNVEVIGRKLDLFA